MPNDGRMTIADAVPAVRPTSRPSQSRVRRRVSLLASIVLAIALTLTVTTPADAQSTFGDESPNDDGAGQVPDGDDGSPGDGSEGDGDAVGSAEGDGSEGDGDAVGSAEGDGSEGAVEEDGGVGAAPPDTPVGCSAVTDVASEDGLSAAVGCYVSQTPPGDHTIRLVADVELTSGTGIEIGPGAHPTTTLLIDAEGHRLSAPTNSSSASVLVFDSAANAVLADAVITNAPGSGVLVRSGSVRFDATAIEAVGGDGLVVEGGSVVVTGSAVAGNGDDGIYVDGSGADVRIESSTVDGNVDNGILIDAGVLVVDGTSVSRNGDDGVDVRNEAQVMLTGVEVADNGDDGVDHGAGTIAMHELHVHGNDGNGIVLNDNSAAAAIADSTSAGNGKAGIVIDGVPASIANTLVLDNAEDGILVENGELAATDVVVRSNGDNGLLLEGGAASFVGGEVSSNADDGFDARSGLRLNVQGVGVLANGDDGFDITDAEVEIVDSYLAANGDDGVGVFGASEVTVIRSSVADNGDDGVDLRGETVVALISNSSIWNSGDDGVRSAGDGVVVANSSILDSSLAIVGADVNGPAAIVSSIVNACVGSVDGGGNVGGCFTASTTRPTVVAPPTCAVPVVTVAGHDPLVTACMPLLAIDLADAAVSAGTCADVPVDVAAGALVPGNLVVDQRGTARPSTECDAGSFEVAGALVTVVQTVPRDAPAADSWHYVLTAPAGCLAGDADSVELTVAGGGGSAVPVPVGLGCAVTVVQTPKDDYLVDASTQTVIVTEDVEIGFVSEPRRTLTITKTILADPLLGLALDDDFEFSASGVGSFTLDAPPLDDGDDFGDTIVFDALPAGSRMIVEAGDPNWIPVDVRCDGAAAVVDSTTGFGVEVVVDNTHRHVACVFVNASDVDGDGIADVDDEDNDNDGQSDSDERTCGSDALDPTSRSSDRDGDGIPDCVEVAEVVFVCMGIEVLATDDGGYSAPGFEGKIVVGTERRDWLFGSSGPDLVLALGGDDVVIAGRGDDIVCGGDGNDLIIDGKGDDRIDGGAGHDAIHGSLGDDRIVGGDGSDFLSGGWGDDRIDGNGGDDRLFGGVGNDDLDGGEGRDLCEGGWGRDTERNCERRTVRRSWWC